MMIPAQKRTSSEYVLTLIVPGWLRSLRLVITSKITRVANLDINLS